MFSVIVLEYGWVIVKLNVKYFNAFDFISSIISYQEIFNPIKWGIISKELLLIYLAVNWKEMQSFLKFPKQNWQPLHFSHYWVRESA